MAKLEFNVNLSPLDAQAKLTEQERIVGKLVHLEYVPLVNGKEITISVFERYFIRVSNRAALTVICNNQDGVTNVKMITTGSSEGMVFHFDWGASKSYVNEAAQILEHYIEV
ncbi:DUF6054 family protein [Bacillus sp. 1P06AnD]|uniref:DUF6054 family protein n=1 Tax=Bacillus sp. 1P06AnD TaxID=3132208 RepID=UPI0039A21860